MALNNNFFKFLYLSVYISLHLYYFFGKIKMKNGKKIINSEQGTKLISAECFKIVFV